MARLQLSNEYVEESASESEASASGEDIDETRTHTGLVNQQSNGSLAPSSSESSTSISDNDESEAESDSSSQASGTHHLKRKLSSQNGSSSNKKAKSAPAHIPTRAYQPPMGYSPLKPQTPFDGITASDLISKQLWHITAPASIAIGKLKSFNLQASLRGESILEHQGKQYSFHTAAGEHDTLLLALPQSVSTGRGSEVTTAYETSSTPITRTLNLREIAYTRPRTEHPSLHNGSAPSGKTINGDETNPNATSYFATELGSKPAPRKQPSGLMMRYHPFGNRSTSKEILPGVDDMDVVLDEANSEKQLNGFAVPSALSDDEMHADVPSRMTEKEKLHKKKKKKQKDHANVNEDDTLVSPRKVKKDKRKKGDDADGRNGDGGSSNIVGTQPPDSQEARIEKKKNKHRK